MSDNPYSPPTSNVSTTPDAARSVWWKVYFFLFLLISLLSWLGVLGVEGAGVVEVVNGLVSLVAFVGLFGFVFGKRLLQPTVWLVVLVLTLLADVSYSFLTGVDLAAGMDRTGDLLSQAVAWALSLPTYVGLFLYSRPSHPVWHDPASKG